MVKGNRGQTLAPLQTSLVEYYIKNKLIQHPQHGQRFAQFYQENPNWVHDTECEIPEETLKSNEYATGKAEIDRWNFINMTVLPGSHHLICKALMEKQIKRPALGFMGYCAAAIKPDTAMKAHIKEKLSNDNDTEMKDDQTQQVVANGISSFNENQQQEEKGKKRSAPGESHPNQEYSYKLGQPVSTLVSPWQKTNPVPTLFWLTHPGFIKRIGHVENVKWEKSMEDEIMDPTKESMNFVDLILDNIYYIHLRWCCMRDWPTITNPKRQKTSVTLASFGNSEGTELAITDKRLIMLLSSGVGGCIDFRYIRCCHMHYAYYLASLGTQRASKLGYILESRHKELEDYRYEEMGKEMEGICIQPEATS